MPFQITQFRNYTIAQLLRFFVRRVLAATITELAELKTAGGRLLVLGRRVIALFALIALQRNNFPHLLNPTFFCLFVYARRQSP